MHVAFYPETVKSVNKAGARREMEVEGQDQVCDVTGGALQHQV